LGTINITMTLHSFGKHSVSLRQAVVKDHGPYQAESYDCRVVGCETGQAEE